MATGPRYAVKYRRRREGRTNYHKRRKLLLSQLPRLVVRKSNKYITAQLVDYDARGDKTLATANSSQLKKLGWKESCKNIPAAYLTGLLIGKKAIEAGIKKSIPDLGFYTITKGSKLFAVLKGAIDAGLDIPHDPKIFPSEERLTGKHIAEYLKKPSIVEDFEKIKKKILG